MTLARRQPAVAALAILTALAPVTATLPAQKSIYVPATLNSSRLPDLDVRIVSEYLPGLVRKGAPCATSRSMSQSEVAALIGRDRMERLLSQRDESRASEIGEAVNASYILASRLEYSGSAYVLSLSLIDQKAAAVVARSSAESKTPDGVLDALEKGVKEMELIELLCPWKGTITITAESGRDTSATEEERAPAGYVGGPPVITKSRMREQNRHTETWTIEKTGRTRTGATGNAAINIVTSNETASESSGITCVNGTVDKHPANRHESTKSGTSTEGGGPLANAKVEVTIAESGEYHIGVSADPVTVKGRISFEHSMGDDCYPTKTERNSAEGEGREFTLPWTEITGSGAKRDATTLSKTESFTMLDVKITVKVELKRS